MGVGQQVCALREWVTLRHEKEKANYEDAGSLVRIAIVRIKIVLNKVHRKVFIQFGLLLLLAILT